MSYVMNAMLGYDIMEDEGARMAEVNAYLQEQRDQEFGPDVNEGRVEGGNVVGGYKAFEHPLHLAAFNYVTADTVREAVAAARWEYPQHVQLFICDQEEDVFTVYGVERAAT